MQSKLSSFDQTMKLFAVHDSRLAVLERKVGLFALAGMGALILLFFVVAFEQGMFASTTPLRFQTHDAGMIREGMEVKLRGFKVGKLTGISLQENGLVEVSFFVDNQYLPHIRRGTKIRLAEQGLLGSGALEIIPGGQPGQPVLAANEILPFEQQLGMSALAHELAERLKPILDDIQTVATSLNQQDGLLSNANRAAMELEKTGQHASVLLQHAREAVAEENARLGKVLDGTGTALNKTGLLLDKTGVLMDQAGILLNDLRGLTSDAKKISASSAENIPPLLGDGRMIAEDTRDIIYGVRQAWPIRNMLAPQETEMLPMDSYGTAPAPQQ